MMLFVDFLKPLTFPANIVNRIILALAPFTPFVREGYQGQKTWEKSFFRN